MLAAASSPYQTFGAYTGVSSAEPNPSDSRKSSKSKRTFLALIVSLALLSLLGFAAHSGSFQKEELLSQAKSFAQQNSRPHFRAHAKNPEKICENWAGGSSLAAGTKAFEIPMGDEIDIQFTLSFSDEDLAKDVEDGSLLYIGNSEEEFYPALLLQREGGESGEAELEIVFHDASETSSFKKYPSSSQRFDHTASSIQVRLLLQEEEWFLFIDGEEEEDDSIEESYKPSGPTDFGVYAAAKTSFYKGATTASATISDLQICVTNAWIPPTASPTPAPTATTPAPTVSPDCEEFANSDAIPLSASSEPLFEVEVTGQMDISFSLMVDQLNNGAELESILHVGSTSDERSPSIYLPQHSEEKIYIAFNPSLTDDTNNKFATLDIQTGVEYRIQILLNADATKAEILVDGIPAASVDGGSDALVLLREGVPVYAAADFFGDGAAKAVLTELSICSFDCFESTAEMTVSQGNRVFPALPVSGSLDLSFSVTVNEGSKYGNVLQIGDADHNEWPSVNFRPTAEGEGKLVVEFEQRNAQRYFGQEIQIETGKQYKVDISIDALEATIALDGAKQGGEGVSQIIAIPSEFTPQSGYYPLYASNPWSASSADAKVEGLSVCAGESTKAGCTRFPGEATLENGYELFEAFVGGDFDLSFEVQLTSSVTGNFFEIGRGYEEVVRFYWSTGDDLLLYFKSDESGTNSGWFSDAMYDGQGWYQIVLQMRGSKYNLLITGYGSGSKGTDGVFKEMSNVKARVAPGVFGFYAPKDGKGGAGKVRDVLFCNV